jgi:hypothetical protein
VEFASHMGRFSLRKGEGEDEGFNPELVISEPLTFILSPYPRGRGGRTGARGRDYFDLASLDFQILRNGPSTP